MNIPLALAIAGLALECWGLYVLIGKDISTPLQSAVNRGLDGLDEWVPLITDTVNDLRWQNRRAAFFIVAGIVLQTFPEYYWPQ